MKIVNIAMIRWLLAGMVMIHSLLLAAPEARAEMSTIASGDYFSCAVTQAGGVKCWGMAAIPVTQRTSAVVDIAGLSGEARAVTAGRNHACALTNAGGVKCWGDNYYGQLGDGTRLNRYSAVDVPGLGNGVLSLSAGSEHTCAVTAAGAAMCWGWNRYGQIGNGSHSETPVTTPTVVASLSSGVASIAAETGHTCALTTAGGVKCWGSNHSGQIGNGTSSSTQYVTTPASVVGLGSGVAAIAAGNSHSCALLASGGAKCWGLGSNGELGEGNDGGYDGIIRTTPVNVAGLADVKAIASNWSFNCALTAAGAARCWGFNENGQLGDGTTTKRLAPVAVAGISGGATAIATGLFHACAVVAGTVKCWGQNAASQLAADMTDSPIPVDVGGVAASTADLGSSPAGTATTTTTATTTSTTATTTSTTLATAGSRLSPVANGAFHTLALKPDGSLWAWGLNANGQLGDGSRTDSTTPRQIGTGYVSVAAGSAVSFALKSDGSLWAWGYNFQGQIGDGSRTDSLLPKQIGSGFAAVSLGTYHAAGLKSDGSLWAWGSKATGDSGNGVTTTTISLVPTQIGTGYAAVAAGGEHTLALNNDSSLWAWGLNRSGQLGDGTTADSATPKQIATGFVAISAGDDFSVGLKADGSLWAWGSNGFGQLGDGSTTNSLRPKQIATGFVAVAAGASHVVALKSDGSLWTWGVNAYGQLGDGTTSNRASPRQIATGFVAIDAGRHHTSAVKSNGSLWTWGYNSYGQLGDGSTTTRSAPSSITGGFGTAATTQVSLIAGWNLVGNSAGSGLTLTGMLADAARVTSVWKWLPATGQWAFHAPSISATDLAAYASAKGYAVLSGIEPGEGFWVNARGALIIDLPPGTTAAPGLFPPPGWNLVAIGTTRSPGQLNTELGPLQTLWAWDSVQSKWYFYAPGLAAQGGTRLHDYILSKDYLDFSASSKVLGHGVGFWINKAP